jgi:hypothetical protein
MQGDGVRTLVILRIHLKGEISSQYIDYLTKKNYSLTLFWKSR